MNHPLFDLLTRLDQDRVHYILGRHRADSVLVTATFVGERVEIDVFADGHMEVSRFLGTEDVLGGAERVFDLLDKKKFEEKAWSQSAAEPKA